MKNQIDTLKAEFENLIVSLCMKVIFRTKDTSLPYKVALTIHTHYTEKWMGEVEFDEVSDDADELFGKSDCIGER